MSRGEFQLRIGLTPHPFAKKALTLHLARGEGRERYFGCNLMQRKVLASSHQHLMAEAPHRTRSSFLRVTTAWSGAVIYTRRLPKS